MDFSKLILPARFCCNKEVFLWCVTFQLESKGHDLSEGEWSPVARLFFSSAVNLQFSFDEVLFMPLIVSVLTFSMENCLLPYVCSLHSKPLFSPITASRLCCNRNNNYNKFHVLILSLNLTLWLPPIVINWSYSKSLCLWFSFWLETVFATCQEYAALLHVVTSAHN